MQKTLMASLIGLAVCTGNAFSPALAAEAKQPNLVIIMADDLGYGDLATYGHQIVKTPNIDRLAQEGVKFTDYYAPAPLSSPSRAGLLTGRMPFRTGIRSWIPSGKDVALGRNELTIAPISHKHKIWALITHWLIRRALLPTPRWITLKNARVMAWFTRQAGYVMGNPLHEPIK